MVDRINSAHGSLELNRKQIPAKRKDTPASPSFDKLLKEQQHKLDLKISAHAQDRIRSRRIDFGRHEVEKLSEAVDKARSKGARDSLILIDGNAYIVSVENETVITAVDRENISENVFTNIDSAVVM